jgi:hypothetical protein
MIEANMNEPSARAFDLNVGTVLEHWTAEFALREIIANALDEQALTQTTFPEVFVDEAGWWHIRDYGRGIRHINLTQDESPEKQSDDRVIGQFGMGLKDALALFDRIGVEVEIRSKYGDITLGRHAKSGFEDVVTLHALVSEPSEPDMVGTDVAVRGVSSSQVQSAKEMFLAYRSVDVLEETSVGQVIAKASGEPSSVFVRGLLVAIEDNFLFSYNITSLTTALKRALNRERSNVGRTAYSDRVKKILLESTSEAVAGPLARDLAGFASGDLHDEVAWSDVAVQATRIMQASQKVMFVSGNDYEMSAIEIDHARADGYEIIQVPDKIADRLVDLTDLAGKPMVNVGQYSVEWNDSFQYSFVDPVDLTDGELAVLGRSNQILALLGMPPAGTGRIKAIKVSETMRIGQVGFDADGVWDSNENSIIVARHQLADAAAFAGTLLHEVCHARSGYSDLSVAFESDLSDALGEVAARALAITSRRSD